jgi:hypothetical protein
VPGADFAGVLDSALGVAAALASPLAAGVAAALASPLAAGVAAALASPLVAGVAAALASPLAAGVAADLASPLAGLASALGAGAAALASGLAAGAGLLSLPCFFHRVSAMCGGKRVESACDLTAAKAETGLASSFFAFLAVEAATAHLH